MHAHGRRGPLAVQPVGDRLEALLIAAVIAEEDDVAEAVQPEAARRGLEDLLEGVLRHRDRFPESACAPSAARCRPPGTYAITGATSALPSARAILSESSLHPHVVLAQHHVRTVLLGAADRHDDRRRSGPDPALQLGPRQLVDEHAVRRRAERAAMPASSRKSETSHGAIRFMSRIMRERTPRDRASAAAYRRGASLVGLVLFESLCSRTGCRALRMRRLSISTPTAKAIAK